jgi:hypothetical protein
MVVKNNIYVMNNLKSFDEYYKTNEGFFENFSGRLIFDRIKRELQNDENLRRLTTGNSEGESRDKFYKYSMNGGDIISVSIGGGEFHNPPQIYFNNNNMSREVNSKIIINIYNFLEEKYQGVNEGFGKNIVTAGLLSLALASGKGQDISKMHPYKVVKLTMNDKEKLHMPKKPDEHKTATPFKKPSGSAPTSTHHSHKPKPKKINTTEYGIITKKDRDIDELKPLKPRTITNVNKPDIKPAKIKKIVNRRTKEEQEEFVNHLCKVAKKMDRDQRKTRGNKVGNKVIGCLSSSAAKWKEADRQAKIRKNRDPHW